MPRKPADAIEPLEPLIRNLRGERVILDSDLARVYGVEARVLNQAVKRNAERFPSDFAFQLTLKEAEDIRSQFVTGSLKDVDDKKDNSSQIVMSSRRGRTYFPWAFTEHGALMAANVLRRLEKMDEKLMEHDEALLIVWNQLKELMQPAVRTSPPPPPKPRIGFHS